MVKIVSRKSDLAIIQAEYVAKELRKINKNIDITFIKKETQGDIDQLTSLSSLSDVGVFTNDIRKSLLEDESDIAVHSLKDLPVENQAGTVIASILKRGDIRDILFLKRNSFDEYNNKNIKILTSSPRRSYNFSNFLNSLLPFEPKEIIFEDVRGNIPTRLNKLVTGDCDGLIVAKAAIDRLVQDGSEEISNYIKNLINDLFWMIAPVSLNPSAPGQGAIAIEVNSKRKDLIELVSRINDKETYESVLKERRILSGFGGGCHQKIGVTYENKIFGEIFTLTGLTEDGKELKERKIEGRKKIPWNNVDIENFFPNNIEEYKLFERQPNEKNIKKINKIRNSNLWISRDNALPEGQNIDSSNMIWTSGVKTWLKLAKKGYWVNGTADSLGEEDPKVSNLTNNRKWVKFTHSQVKGKYFKNPNIPENAKILSTYKLKPLSINEDLSKKTHFYWMSGSAFKLALDNYPEIIQSQHACGPGNTYKYIKKYIKDNNLNILLGYEDALGIVERSGEDDENL